MRILFVAMGHSVHFSRWVGQLEGQAWDLHLFPVDDRPLHPDLRDLTIHAPFPGVHGPAAVRMAGPRLPLSPGGGLGLAREVVARLPARWTNRPAALARQIRTLRPDIVHVLHMQHAGYQTLASREHGWGGALPAILFSSWGSDFFYYGRQPEHEARVRAFTALCDYHIADCRRDVDLARHYGFRGQTLGVLPVFGGFDIRRHRRMRAPGAPSGRRVVALKGYHDDGWAGRALVGLHALTLCADDLAGYEIIVYSATENTRHASEFVARSTGLSIRVLPPSPHDEVIALMGRARIAIGLSITDGWPSALLEAMVMGAFPIQSDTVSTAEWITSGQNGLLVPPEDAHAVAAAIHQAVRDDRLVDEAAVMNEQAIASIDMSVVRPQALAAYRSIAERRGAAP